MRRRVGELGARRNWAQDLALSAAFAAETASAEALQADLLTRLTEMARSSELARNLTDSRLLEQSATSRRPLVCRVTLIHYANGARSGNIVKAGR